MNIGYDGVAFLYAIYFGVPLLCFILYKIFTKSR